MILFDLHCASGHVFEAWFRDGAAYEEQVLCGQISCPHCGHREVSKAPMAPAIVSSASGEKAGKASEFSNAEAKDTLRILEALKREIEDHFKDVGDKLPEEARKMHYGEKKPANLRGSASLKEVKSMWDEGIPVLPLSVPAKKIN